VLFSVYDTRENPLNRNGDPFLYSLGINAKFLDKNEKLDGKKWTDSTLSPTIDWDMNKNFGDTHPDYKKLLTDS